MNQNWFNAKIVAVLPFFIAVNIAAILIWSFDISDQSMAFVLGIIAGGLVDLDNRFSGRLKNIFYTLFAFSISSLVAQLSINFPILFIGIMTALTFTLTMLGAIGQRYNTIAFGCLVVSLYTILAYLPETAWYLNPVMIVCGAGLYSVVAIIIYLFFPNKPVQENIAKAFLALADYLEAKASFFDPDDIDSLENKQVNLAMKNGNLVNLFNACRLALFYRLRGENRHQYTKQMLRYYFAAQDIHERANSTHLEYQVLAEKLKNTDLLFRIQRLLELQAQACRDLSYKLQQNQNYHYNLRLARAIEGIKQSFDFYDKNFKGEEQYLFHIQVLLENLQGIDAQLRSLEQENTGTLLEERSETAKIYTENITGLTNIFYVIKSHCTFESQLFRHAVRLSIVVFICCVLVEVLSLDRGFWVLLTAIFVCQPNYSATKTRLKQRIIGTILGVIVGSLLPYFTSTLEAKLGLMIASSTLFFFFRTNNYSYSTFFITIQVLVSFDIMGFDIYSAMFPRVIDTVIGALISGVAVFYLWPDWKYIQLDKASIQAIKSNAKYLLYITSQFQMGKVDNLKYRIARRNAHECEALLSSTLAMMNSEPNKYAKSLQQGFQILKINSSLLSYISALGTYRKKMRDTQQSAVFIAVFYPLAKKVIYLMENIDKLSEDEFNKLHLSIVFSLKQFKSDSIEMANYIPVQQLEMITSVLPSLYEIVTHQLKQKVAMTN